MRALVTNKQLVSIAEAQTRELQQLSEQLARARAAAYPMLGPLGWSAPDTSVKPPGSPKPAGSRPVVGSACMRMSPTRCL